MKGQNKSMSVTTHLWIDVNLMKKKIFRFEFPCLSSNTFSNKKLENEKIIFCYFGIEVRFFLGQSQVSD
jgi:hypothetical protein